MPKSAFETMHISREIAISTHKKEDFVVFCDETVCGEMAIFTTSSNLRVQCACDVLLMDDCTFSLSLKIHFAFSWQFFALS